MKIKRMIITLFIFLSLIPLTLFGIVNSLYYNGRLEKLLENDLKVAVSTQIKSIDNFFCDRQSEAAILCDMQTVKDMLARAGKAQGEDMRTLEEILKLRVQKTDFLDRMLITDTDFQVVVSSDESRKVEKGITELAPSYFGSKLRFTQVLTSENEGQGRYLAAIQGIYDEEKPIGYLIMRINLYFFEELRASAKLFNNGTIYILDNQNNLIAAGDTIASRSSFVLNEYELQDYRRAWNGRDREADIGILKYKAMGERYMSCYMVADKLDWTVISSVNLDKILGYRRVFVSLTVIVILVLGLLLFLANFLVRRYFAVPINEMIGKFGQIKETGDYGIRMDQGQKNEIGVISKNINSLLDSIEACMEQQKKEKEKFRQKAEKDLMTGLYNKETMYELMKAELERIRADRVPVACLFIDIDDFKDFNTKYGHFGGDQVLRFLARTLEVNFPGIAGRHGGDEFIVMVSGEENIRVLENHIKEVLQTLQSGVILDKTGNQVSVRCSIGAIVADDGNITCEEMIALADSAMYVVKYNDKNSYLIRNR